MNIKFLYKMMISLFVLFLLASCGSTKQESQPSYNRTKENTKIASEKQDVGTSNHPSVVATTTTTGKKSKSISDGKSSVSGVSDGKSSVSGVSDGESSVSGVSDGESISDKKIKKLSIDAKILVKEEEHKAKDEFNTESYDRIYDNEFKEVKKNPLSTFSVDVDTASYSNVRRFIKMDRKPPKDSVRIEEMLNYFSYNYPSNTGNHPFSVYSELSKSPWNEKNYLLHLGLKGKIIPKEKMPQMNLVFLLDVSGSMNDPNKLPLLKESFRLLVNQLDKKDRVSIVVYAGASGLVLDATGGERKQDILDALTKLEAGGSTNGGQGIQLAYKIAMDNFVKGGNNRIILATDGDFNVGVSNQGDLIRLIEKKRNSGVFLTVLGFGMGNYKDSTMEKLANKGNGNYYYIDTLAEAKKVLVQQMGGTLNTIAKDVKLQLEFNPKYVQSYRLIGYENRVLATEDFHDDKKDAGEIGAGHTVTALYEIVPTSTKFESSKVDPLKYQKDAELSEAANSLELLTVKLRYKQPDKDKSQLFSFPVIAQIKELKQTTEDFRFAASVASFGMILRNSQFKGSSNYDLVLDLAKGALDVDREGYRKEFVDLVKRSSKLD